MKYKVAVFDLDGTLYNDVSTVSLNTLKALTLLKKKMLIGIATGRNHLDIQKNNKELYDLADFIIEENGASVFDHYRRLVIGKDVDVQEFLQLYDSLSSIKRALFFTDSSNHLYTSGDADIIRDFLSHTNEHAKMIILNDLVKYNFKKICITFHLKDKNKIEQIFETSLFNNLSYTQSVPVLFEIQDKDTNKSNALSKYLSDINVDMRHVIAFGDGNNDIEMIKDVGLGIAMKNAMKEVKEIATEETSLTAAEDGVAEYIMNNLMK